MSTSPERTPENIKVLAANMWVVFTLDSPNERYRKFLEHARPSFKQLIESILLYKQTVIPTQDFLSLSALIGVLGERAVIELLESESLKFLRLNGAFGYIGNGGGIKNYEILSPEGQPDPLCGPIDDAIKWCLEGLSEKPTDPNLPRLVLENTVELTASSIMDEIRHETYMDVLKSPYLRDTFALRNKHVDQLTGIGPNQVKIYGPSYGNWQGDEIAVVLSLAAANTELRMAEIAECTDSSTSSPVGHLIKAKAQRSFTKSQAIESFAVLREIADIPDIGEGILEKQIPLSDVLKLKLSRNGEQFQQWFHENCRTNPIVTAREYTSLLRTVPRVQSLPSKIMRFILTAAIGAYPVIGQALGPIATGVDSFFIEKLLRGSSPKFFIEDLRQFQGKLRSPTGSKTKSKRIGRNDPCPCGSGKKYKKCECHLHTK